MPTEPRCFTGGIYCCLGTQVRFTFSPLSILSPPKLSPDIDKSLSIVLERTVASLAPKGDSKGSELRISLLSTRRLAAPERPVVVSLTLVRKTHPFLPTNKSRTRQSWNWNPLYFTYLSHDEIVFYWDFTITLLLPNFTSNLGMFLPVRDRMIDWLWR